MPLDPPPLTALRVLELAGLAPAPFTALALADYGATILRIDPPPSNPNSKIPPPPTPDLLTRHKSSLPINLKHPRGHALFLSLIREADVLIDPFRPFVLERLGLAPEAVLLKTNPRLIVVRIVGFRRDGDLGRRAGHDINYLAASGVLSVLGRSGSVSHVSREASGVGKVDEEDDVVVVEPPYAPSNLLADFGGGGMVALAGVLLALISRSATGRGQVVEVAMEDGVAYLATMMRLGRMGELDAAAASTSAAAAVGRCNGDSGVSEAQSHAAVRVNTGGTWDKKVDIATAINKATPHPLPPPIWSLPRGHNLLDGGCPYYTTYLTSDSHSMAIGALEPKFFAHLLSGLSLPSSLLQTRDDRSTWPALRALFTAKFKGKSRREWEEVFEGTDACVTPVLTLEEMREAGYVQRPLVGLRGSPGLAVSRRRQASSTGHGVGGGGVDHSSGGGGGESKLERPVEEGQGEGVEGDGWTGKVLEIGSGGEEVLKAWMGWERGREVDVVDGGWVRLQQGARL